MTLTKKLTKHPELTKHQIQATETVASLMNQNAQYADLVADLAQRSCQLLEAKEMLEARDRSRGNASKRLFRLIDPDFAAMTPDPDIK